MRKRFDKRAVFVAAEVENRVRNVRGVKAVEPGISG